MDEIVVAAGRYAHDPNPAILDEIQPDLAAGTIDWREYLVRQAGITLALLCWNDEP